VIIGKYKYVVPDDGSRPVFVISARPHIMMKLKRVIPQAVQNLRTGFLWITATKELARDLEWFCERYPLVPFDGQSLAQLGYLADEHRRGEQQIAEILEGDVPDFGEREPAVTPRQYQLTPAAMVRARGFLLLGDDVGLGKTLASSLLFTDSAALRGLVVAPTHLVDQWAEELAKYFPWLNTHKIRQGTPYTTGQPKLYKALHDAEVLLVNYHKLAGWGDYLQGKITTVIFDEAHELRTGPGTGKYVAAAMVAAKAKYRMGCTATPVYNYGKELHNVVSILDPEVLGTPDEFVREWGGDKIKDPRALGAYLRHTGIMLRRTRKEVGRELPPISSMVQPVETDHRKLEAVLADGIVAMAAKVLDEGTDRTERWSLSGQLDMKIRHATGVAKAPYVAEFVKMLLTREKKVVLVGHHHDVYEIWQEKLAAYKPVLYTGRQSPTQKQQAVKDFVDGDSRVLILAVRSGAGLNGLQLASSTMVFGELDWSPAQHHQVIGRLARDGQQEPVAVFYMLSDGGSDPPMEDLLELKRRIAEPINDPDAEVVQPSAQEAMRRVQALAAAVLRQHGIHLDAPVMPEPEPGSGELFPAAAVTIERAPESVDELLATTVQQEAPAPKSRDDLRGRLTGAMRS
jgi:hypothetical protein